MRSRVICLFLVGAAAALPGGCAAGADPGASSDAGDPGASLDATPSPPNALPPSGDPACDKMDILFVVDDSGSMGEEQTNLGANFPRFVAVLDDYIAASGAPLDYRVGVTTTSKPLTTVIFPSSGSPAPVMRDVADGPRGALLTGRGCEMTRPWLERGEPDVAARFACVADVGTEGALVEMPLLMWELALTERVADGTNAGFLREDALLAVVILTDEDDCSNDADLIEIRPEDSSASVGPIDRCDPSSTDLVALDRVLTTVDALKGERGRWAAAVIAGPGPGPCASEFGTAQDAVRLREFIGRVGPNGVLSSICEGDLAAPLTQALNTFDAACRRFPPLI